MREIFDILVMQIQTISSGWDGIGNNVAIDSTPIEGSRTIPIQNSIHTTAVKGYKVHGVYDLDFQLPVALEFTKVNDGDAPHLPSLLDSYTRWEWTQGKSMPTGLTHHR